MGVLYMDVINQTILKDFHKNGLDIHQEAQLTLSSWYTLLIAAAIDGVLKWKEDNSQEYSEMVDGENGLFHNNEGPMRR